jgi:phosphate-selective porin
MLTRAFGRHRLSARYDDFDVQPIADPDKYTNRDKGHAWTASWLYDLSDSVRLGAEYLTIATEHCETDQCAWVYHGLPRTSRQDQVQITLRWQFRESL